MKSIKYILVFLALAWMTKGCGTESKAPEDYLGSNEIENRVTSYSTESKVPEDYSGSNEVEIKSISNTEETKPSNWYIRLTVEDPARAMKSSSSQLGALEVSDVVEDHTLKANMPFGSSYLGIVFVDPDGVEPGAYKTNFHAYGENVEDRWRFTVRTDDADAQILLSWRGLYVLTPYVDDQGRTRYKEYRSLSNPLNKHMKLVDTSTGDEMLAIVEGKVQTYTFTMDGNERTFEWVIQNEELVLSQQTAKFSTLKAKAIRMDAKVEQEKMMQKKAESFDLSKPPMIQQEM